MKVLRWVGAGFVAILALGALSTGKIAGYFSYLLFLGVAFLISPLIDLILPKLNLPDIFQKLWLRIVAGIVAFILAFAFFPTDTPTVQEPVAEVPVEENPVDEITEVEIEPEIEEVVEEESEPEQNGVDIDDLPPYAELASIKINDGKPYFTEEDLNVGDTFEKYEDLDDLGRCVQASALLSKETLPTEARGQIGSIEPTGWHTVKYENIEDLYLYNRCHLIAYELSGQNDNIKNLITGTRYMNVEGMLPYEDEVAEYLKTTENHVLYRVTPIYKDKDLLASGVVIEAKSIEDDGEGISICAYCYNVQPGIIIDYATGDSKLTATAEKEIADKKAEEKAAKAEAEKKVQEENTNQAAQVQEVQQVTATENVVDPGVANYAGDGSSGSSGNSESSGGNGDASNFNTYNNVEQQQTAAAYVLNTNTMKIHHPGCKSVPKIAPQNYAVSNASVEELLAQGYTTCGNCF